MKKITLSAPSLIALGLLSLSLPGCGKSNGSNAAPNASSPSAQQPVTQADPSSLNGLSPDQLLRTKYDRAELDCSASLTVTTTKATSGGLESTTNPPQSGSASLDLLHDGSGAKTLSFKVSSGNVAYDVQVLISKIAITPGEDLSIGNDSYNLTQTPVLSISASAQLEKPVSVGGVVLSGSLNLSPDMLYENIPSANKDTETDKVTGPAGAEEDITLQSVNCMLNTQLKPQYQNEWQKLN